MKNQIHQIRVVAELSDPYESEDYLITPSEDGQEITIEQRFLGEGGTIEDRDAVVIWTEDIPNIIAALQVSLEVARRNAARASQDVL